MIMYLLTYQEIEFPREGGYSHMMIHMSYEGMVLDP